ncbi:MAG TPA: hypothetical protein VMZ01_04430 [Aestuariivirga sp.]|nr:hypothetical protein [Aestuariivirga sp.]
MDISVLHGLTASNLETRPFAHLVRDRVYADDLYAKLATAFPPPQRFVGGLTDIVSNQAIRIPAVDIIDNPEFDPLWRRFFAYHTSKEFWLEVLEVMGDGIRAAHPNLEKTFGKKLEDFIVSRRGSGIPGDIMLDALFVVNTPVTKASSVRPAHVDSENEIYAGLLYMRSDDDKTPGGDLSLYHFKGQPRFGGHYAELTDVVEDKTVSYAANRLAAFVNSAASVHGVTPRPPTDKYRRYINIIGTTDPDVFDLPKLPLHRKLRFWLKRRLKKKPRGMMAKKSDY